MDTFEAILKRRSVRKFLDKQISESQIEKLMQAAMAAPSAVNKQPWEFIIVENKEKQDLVKSCYPHWNFNSPLLIVVCGNKKRFLPNEAEGFWIQDCSAAVENILLEACDLGLGAVWCGVYPSLVRAEKLREILEINTDLIPFSLIHVGYPLVEPEPRTQYDKEKIHKI